MKNHLFWWAFLVGIFFVASCQKTIETEEDAPKDDTEEENDDDWWQEHVEVDSAKVDNVLTVAEAIEAEYGEEIIVKGYIVGAAKGSRLYSEYAPPFHSSTSIILADKQISDDVEFYDDELFPVCLTDYKRAREDLNLVDHPEYHNKIVYIFGIKKTYMNMPGIKNVIDFWLEE